MKFKKLFARKKNNRRTSRANEFMLESLEPRLLLSATPMTAAVVTTDHLDYAPGETAVITTSNQAGDGFQFSAGEMVSFQITRTDGMADYVGSTAGVGPAGNEAWYVVDGVGGFTAHLGSDVSGDGVADWIAPDNDLTVNSSISTTWFVEEQYRNSSLLVTASGQESGAMATQAFTDAAINTTTVLTSNVAASTYGDVVTFTATVTAAIGTDAPDGTVEFWDGSTLMGVSTVPDSTGSGTATWSIPSYQYLIEGPHSNIHAVFIPTDPAIFNDSTSASITHTVAAKQITASFTVADKVYDGSTAATGVIVTLNGILVPDDVSATFSSITFSDANVGSNKTVTLTGLELIGTERLNYSLLSTTLTGTGNITAKELTVSFTVDSKVYDGSTAATIVGTPSLLGVIGGEDVSLSGGAATFDTANAGTGKTVTFTGGTLSGAAAGNYSLALSSTTTADITAKAITGSFTASNKTYDGSTTAAVQTRTLSGVIGVDDVSLINGTADFDTKDVGTGKTVTLTGATLGGAAAGNYSLASVNTTTANITALGITGNFTAANKVYDGTTAATVQTRTLSGVLAGDVANVNLTGGTATFNNANAGIGKTVTLTGATLGGAASGNYSLASVNTTTANITKANITFTVTGYAVRYDGQAHTATATATGVNGEDLSAGVNLSGTTHTNVGTGTYTDTVTYTDTTGNYFNATKLVKNYISKANITFTVTGYAVKYDGQAHTATATATGVNGEDLSAGVNLSGTTHTNVGTGVYTDTVTYTDTTGNYFNATKLVKNYFSKANITFTVTGYAVHFDGAAHTATATATGVNGEDLSAGVNLSGTTHTNVGTYTDTVTYTDTTGNYLNASKLVKNYIV